MTQRVKCASARTKLKDVTFTRNSKPIRSLLWCNKVPKGKRNKPAKVNGILVSEVQVYHEL